jgi:hypothetical protein
MEAKETGTDYLPDANHAQFSGKTITDVSATGGGTSGHGTTVGIYFYGNSSSQAPGITQIDAYQADDWINNNVMNKTVETRDVQNHSYIGYVADQSDAEDVIRRVDYMIDRDDYVSCFGLNNGSSTEVPEIWGYTYNGIVVGRSDGNHSEADEPQFEGAGRIKPDIVAPLDATSWATPVVASSAALLLDHARDTGLSDAEHSQVIKALLMAGATKDEFGGAWDNTGTRPLDTTYGAGELNIYNSYHMLAAGQYDASDTSLAAFQGWDWGHADASAAHYFLDIPTGFELQDVSALVTWNREVAGANSLSFTNLDLELKTAAGFQVGNLVAASDSPVDNVEHLYFGSLGAGRYVFEINDLDATEADYGFSWRGDLVAVPEPGSWMLCLPALLLIVRRRRSRA